MNVYIHDHNWSVNKNTQLYLPFNGNYNDESGKGTTLTLTSGSIAYSTTTQGEQYANLASGVLLKGLTSNFDINNWTNSQWVYLTNTAICVGWYAGGDTDWSSAMNGYGTGIIFDSNAKILLFKWAGDIQTNVQITRNAWHNIIITQGSGTTKIYIDGEQQYSSSITYSKKGETFGLLGNPYGQYSDKFKGRYDEFILEQGVWDDTDVSNYYNATKANYGI